MPEQPSKALPFAVDRARSTSLTDQVANGLRGAIMTGYYRVGEVLPTLLDMAELLGVSAIVTRAAIRKLAKEGLLSPRPKVGIVVCDPGSRPWQAQVLYLSMSGPQMYYHSVLVGALSERLLAKRILFENLHLSWRERSTGFPQVKTVLGASQIDLAVVEGDAEDALQLLHQHGIPAVHISGAGKFHPELSCGMVASDILSAYEMAGKHAQACGVRTVWLLVSFGQDTARRVFAGRPGMACESIEVVPLPDVPSPMGLEQSALTTMQRHLQQRPELPDMIIFSDDFIASGALLAMSEAGIRIPADVQVCTRSNYGLGPVYFKPLTRIESDGAADGAQIADYLLQCLQNPRASHAALRLSPCFIPGETSRLKGGAAQPSPLQS